MWSDSQGEGNEGAEYHECLLFKKSGFLWRIPELFFDIDMVIFPV